MRLSWAWVIPFAADGATVVDGRGWPTHLPALLGPVAGRGGVHGAGRPPGAAGTRRQHAAVADRLALVAGGGQPAAGPARRARACWRSPAPICPPRSEFARFSGVPAAWGLLGVAAVIVFIGGLGEETGWRGYLQPALQQRFGVLPATGLVAVAWAAWHAPQFFLIGTYEDFPPAMLPVFVGAWPPLRSCWPGCTTAPAASWPARSGTAPTTSPERPPRPRRLRGDLRGDLDLRGGAGRVLLTLHRRAARAGRRSVLAP